MEILFAVVSRGLLRSVSFPRDEETMLVPFCERAARRIFMNMHEACVSLSLCCSRESRLSETPVSASDGDDRKEEERQARKETQQVEDMETFEKNRKIVGVWGGGGGPLLITF